MLKPIGYCGLITVVMFNGQTEAAQGRTTVLEEVIVTAQKREQSLQNAPIAISVLNESQLTTQGITGLSHLIDGTVSSLQVRPHPDDPSTLVVAIRGNGPGDIVDATREGAVAVYMDDIYLGRIQSLGMELADLERIEVLRGPQGTLFGRNATGGAISMVSKKPSGELGLRQTLGVGRFNQLRSLTHLDLPEWNNIRTKVSYFHEERDGWVDNTASGEWDYNTYDKDGGRFSLNWLLNDKTTLDYAFDLSDVESSQMYFQIDRDIGGLFENEPGRQTKTRFPVAPLDPSRVKQYGHALTLAVELTEQLEFKSLSSYRVLDNNTRNNYAGAFYYDGVILQHDIDHVQKTQEFRLVGSAERLEFVAGLFYFQEEADTDIRWLFSLDTTVDPITPINPPTNISPTFGIEFPSRATDAESTSVAAYGQATWTPPVLNDKLKMALGLRHTKDERSGKLFVADTTDDFDLELTHTDPVVIFSYDWTDDVLTYVKWGTAFRGGGANSLLSFQLNSYDEEEVDSYEIGMKSEFANRRVRVNATLFWTDYTGAIVDMFDQAAVEGDSINAAKKVEVDGAELDITLIPLDGLTVGINYTYLDGHMPLQPNPLDNGALVALELPQTPKHAGSLTVDYTFNPAHFGTLSAHLNIISTDNYHYFHHNADITDSYTLANARLTLASIPVAGNTGNLEASVWANNVTDEEYAVFAQAFEGKSKIKAYGTPRTFGLDVTYQF